MKETSLKFVAIVIIFGISLYLLFGCRSDNMPSDCLSINVEAAMRNEICPVVILRFSAERLVRSRLTDEEKVTWIIAFVIFNILAGLIFVIYHDYFLSSSKRSS